MEYSYKKANIYKLRDLEKDEQWLQERILEDPSILGLGDLLVLQRERNQPTGGRIDFLMSDPENSIRYEIEIMLGTLDESHIIRTIEYWDIERKRFPNYDHRAVIVAEDITNRFFNVIGILNRAVPIIAIQLNAIVLENNLVLNFTRVLDVVQEEDEDERSIQETVDRKYWEGRSNTKSIWMMDEMIKMIPDNSKLRVTYNRYHVALGTTGVNFCWFHPRKGSHIHIHLRLGVENVEVVLKKFEEKGIESGIHKKDVIILIFNQKEFEDNKDYIKEILLIGETQSSK